MYSPLRRLFLNYPTTSYLRFLRNPAISMCAVVGLAALSPAARATYTFITFDDPNATTVTDAYGINDSGVITGTYFDATGEHGFIDSGGVFTTFDVAGASKTALDGINSSGNIVGSYVDAGGTTHGFEKIGGTVTTITDPNATVAAGTEAFGINDSGEVTGSYATTTSTGFTYSSGVFTDVVDPLGSQTAVAGLNNAGDLAGVYVAGGKYNGFEDIGGTFNTVDVPGALDTQLLGINGSGTVVGTYGSGTSADGFVFDGTNYTTIAVPGATDTAALGINNIGDVVGFYVDSLGNDHGFEALPSTTTPEPSTPGVLAMGIAGIGLSVLCRRKRRVC